MIRRQFLLASSGVGLSACNLIPPLNLKAPSVEVKSVDITDISRTELRFALMLDAVNKNDQDISLSNLVFEFLLRDQVSGNGAAKQTQILLAKAGTTSIPMDFTLAIRPIIDVLKGVPRHEFGKVPYAIKGSALWGTGPIKLPFEKRNTLDSIPKLAQLLRLL